MTKLYLLFLRLMAVFVILFPLVIGEEIKLESYIVWGVLTISSEIVELRRE